MRINNSISHLSDPPRRVAAYHSWMLPTVAWHACSVWPVSVDYVVFSFYINGFTVDEVVSELLTSYESDLVLDTGDVASYAASQNPNSTRWGSVTTDDMATPSTAPATSPKEHQAISSRDNCRTEGGDESVAERATTAVKSVMETHVTPDVSAAVSLVDRAYVDGGNSSHNNFLTNDTDASSNTIGHSLHHAATSHSVHHDHPHHRSSRERQRHRQTAGFDHPRHGLRTAGHGSAKDGHPAHAMAGGSGGGGGGRSSSTAVASSAAGWNTTDACVDGVSLLDYHDHFLPKHPHRHCRSYLAEPLHHHHHHHHHGPPSAALYLTDVMDGQSLLGQSFSSLPLSTLTGSAGSCGASIHSNDATTSNNNLHSDGNTSATDLDGMSRCARAAGVAHDTWHAMNGHSPDALDVPLRPNRVVLQRLLLEEVTEQFRLFDELAREEMLGTPYAFLSNHSIPVSMEDRLHMVQLYYAIDDDVFYRYFGQRLVRFDGARLTWREKVSRVWRWSWSWLSLTRARAPRDDAASSEHEDHDEGGDNFHNHRTHSRNVSSHGHNTNSAAGATSDLTTNHVSNHNKYRTVNSTSALHGCPNTSHHKSVRSSHPCVARECCAGDCTTTTATARHKGSDMIRREGSLLRQWSNLKKVCTTITAMYRGQGGLYLTADTPLRTAVQRCYGVRDALARRYVRAVFAYEHALSGRLFRRLGCLADCWAVCDVISFTWCDESQLFLCERFLQGCCRLACLWEDGRVQLELHHALFGESPRARWQVQRVLNSAVIGSPTSIMTAATMARASGSHTIHSPEAATIHGPSLPSSNFPFVLSSDCDGQKTPTHTATSARSHGCDACDSGHRTAAAAAAAAAAEAASSSFIPTTPCVPRCERNEYGRVDKPMNNSSNDAKDRHHVGEHRSSDTCASKQDDSMPLLVHETHPVGSRGGRIWLSPSSAPSVMPHASQQAAVRTSSNPPTGANAQRCKSSSTRLLRRHTIHHDTHTPHISGTRCHPPEVNHVNGSGGAAIATSTSHANTATSNLLGSANGLFSRAFMIHFTALMKSLTRMATLIGQHESTSDALDVFYTRVFTLIESIIVSSSSSSPSSSSLLPRNMPVPAIALTTRPRSYRTRGSRVGFVSPQARHASTVRTTTHATRNETAEAAGMMSAGKGLDVERFTSSPVAMPMAATPVPTKMTSSTFAASLPVCIQRSASAPHFVADDDDASMPSPLNSSPPCGSRVWPPSPPPPLKEKSEVYDQHGREDEGATDGCVEKEAAQEETVAPAEGRVGGEQASQQQTCEVDRADAGANTAAECETHTSSPVAVAVNSADSPLHRCPAPCTSFRTASLPVLTRGSESNARDDNASPITGSVMSITSSAPDSNTNGSVRSPMRELVCAVDGTLPDMRPTHAATKGKAADEEVRRLGPAHTCVCDCRAHAAELAESKPVARTASLRSMGAAETAVRRSSRPPRILPPAVCGGVKNIRELCLFFDMLPAAWQQLQSVGADDHREVDDVVRRFVSVLRSITELLIKPEDAD